MKKLPARWLFLALAFGASPVGAVPTLTLREAVDQALQKNPVILKAQEEIRRTRGLVVVARAQRLPQVELTGRTQFEQESRFDSGGGGGGGGGSSADLALLGIGGGGSGSGSQLSEESWSVGVRVTQPIFAGGRLAANEHIARWQQEEALAALDSTIEDIVLAVERQFYQALRQRALIKVSEQQIQLLQGELSDQKKRFEAGTAPQFNVLRAETELANAHPPLIRARNAYRVALAELAKLIATGQSPGAETPFDISGTLAGDAPRYDLASGIQTALEYRMEIKGLEKRLLAQREQLKVDNSQLLPQLSVFGGYDFLSSRFEDRDSLNGAIVGLQGSWKIWDSGELKGRREQTSARIRQVELDIEDTRRQVELDVRKAWSQYVEARELIDSQQKSVSTAEESLRQAKARLEAGTATQLDVLTSQTALTQARTNELEARADLKLAVAQFQRAMGVIGRAPKARVESPTKSAK